jgi:hypothetical protein
MMEGEEYSSFNAAIEDVVSRTILEGEKYFRAAIKHSGLVLTGSLKESVKAESAKIAAGVLSNNWEISFNKYWRFKDMKTLRYSQWLNGEAISNYIDNVGVNNFAYVPGYSKPPSSIPTAIAKKRIFWAIMNHRKQVPIVNHNNKKRLYNKTKMSLINVLRRNVLRTMAEEAPKFAKKLIETGWAELD